MSKPPIVSVGFLNQLDLERLGETFTAHIPVPHDDIFAELMMKLDDVAIEPFGKGIAMMPKTKVR